MSVIRAIPLSVKIGLVATAVGLVTFTLSWNFFELWQGPVPGYHVLLFPGNLSLTYIWHPLFTEEIDLIPKLVLMLIGQFAIVTFVVAVVQFVILKVKVIFG